MVDEARKTLANTGLKAHNSRFELQSARLINFETLKENYFHTPLNMN